MGKERNSSDSVEYQPPSPDPHQEHESSQPDKGHSTDGQESTSNTHHLYNEDLHSLDDATSELDEAQPDTSNHDQFLQVHVDPAQKDSSAYNTPTSEPELGGMYHSVSPTSPVAANRNLLAPPTETEDLAEVSLSEDSNGTAKAPPRRTSFRSIFSSVTSMATMSPFSSGSTQPTTPPETSPKTSRSSSTVSALISPPPPRPSAYFHANHKDSDRSTISSVTSVTSASGSNYDLLLNKVERDEPSEKRSEVSEGLKGSFDKLYQMMTMRDSGKASPVGDDDEINWDFWSNCVSNYTATAKSQPKVLTAQIQKGLPPPLRGMLWQLFASSKQADLESVYTTLLKQPSVYEKMIQRDLARTFPRLEYFKDGGGEGQEGLFQVAKAYSAYDKEVGYCQGLGFVIGPLLLNMPEEEAFCLFVRLMYHYGLRTHFTPHMEGLHLRLYQFDRLLAEYVPQVANHLAQQNMRATMYASQWFMTMFAYRFPLDLVYSVYDVVFAEGLDALFRFGIALMKRNEERILSLEFENLIEFLKNEIFEVYRDNTRGFVADTYTVKITTKKLARLAKEYQAEVAKATAENTEIEQLKRANAGLDTQVKELKHAIEALSGDHNTLAQDLVSSKLELAQTQDVNDALKLQVSELKRMLDALPAQVEARVQSEMDTLMNKNAELVKRNEALEDQLAEMESMMVEMKVRYAESENERQGLGRKLNDLRKMMGA